MSTKKIGYSRNRSGVGKTTFTIGIMAALQQKGYTVQGFKCGPDYIDPSYHTAVTAEFLEIWIAGCLIMRRYAIW